MSEQKTKLGKKGAIHEIAKKLTELREKPVSPKVHEIVRENYERNQKDNKKVAKQSGDLEA